MGSKREAQHSHQHVTFVTVEEFGQRLATLTGVEGARPLEKLLARPRSVPEPAVEMRARPARLLEIHADVAALRAGAGAGIMVVDPGSRRVIRVFGVEVDGPSRLVHRENGATTGASVWMATTSEVWVKRTARARARTYAVDLLDDPRASESLDPEPEAEDDEDGTRTFRGCF